MPFVLDTSLTMSWCFADESTDLSRSVLESLSHTYAEVPALWLVEVANVLAINERKSRINTALSDEFLTSLSGLDIRVDQREPRVDGTDLLPLVRRYGLTAYDAAYLELAKRKGLPLATFDKDLIRVAPQEGVALVGDRKA
jgi:predicted nucleic acid-binding protein